MLPPPDLPTKQLFSLEGKVIVLTGGAGLYGRGLAAQLAATGAKLILAARNVAAAVIPRKLGHLSC